MRKLLFLALLGVVTSCDYDATGPQGRLYPPGASAGITDALHGLNGNPHFFWLAPVVAQPPESEFAAFDATATPTVRVLCEAASHPSNCPGGVLGSEVASFTIGTGLSLQVDHYQLDFDTKSAYGANGDYLLRTSTADRTDVTTYQFVVELTHSQLGTQAIGDVSFELGETGADVKSLSTDETIALKDGRVFPVKMRIEEDALEYGVVQALSEAGLFAADPDFAVGGAPCEVNCEIHVIEELTAYDAYLHKPGVAYAVTGVRFDATALDYPAVIETSGAEASTLQLPPNSFVVIIDERVTEHDAAGQENCALGIETDKWHCYRYLIYPDVEFQHEVPVGICPEAVDLSVYRMLRVDYDANENPILSRPAAVDVSSFLPCQPPVDVPQDGLSLLIGAAQSTLDWLFPPLFAQTTLKVWGGMANDFSDWFFGLDSAQGLLLHYSFEGDLANTGILAGYTGTGASVTYPTGKFGQAIKFDGTPETGATFSGTHEVFGRGGPDWTISLWFREDQKQPESLLFDFRGLNQGWQTYHGVQSTEQPMVTCSDGGCLHFGSAVEVWHNIVYRYDGVSEAVGAPVDIFVDGVLAGQLENANSIPLVGSGTSDIRIGNGFSEILGPSTFFLDELKVYNRVFTLPEQCTEVIGGTWSTANSACTLPQDPIL